MRSQQKDIKDELRFSCISQNQKGIIKAVHSKLNVQYIGQIPSSVDIQDVAEAIEKRQYKVLSHSLQILKIKVGFLNIHMSSNFSLEWNKLKVENQQLRRKNKFLYDKVTILDPMSLPFQDIKWSQQLKEKNIEIDQYIVKKTKKQGNCQYALLQVGFSPDVKRKQFWAIKYKSASNEQPLRLGIYLKKSATYTKFDLDCYAYGQYYQDPQYGGYFISSKGQDDQYGQDNYKFDEGDVIYMEYDPIEWKLRFRKNANEEKFEMKIEPPPAGDAYHPCVEFQEQGQSAELISLTSLVSWNEVFKLSK